VGRRRSRVMRSANETCVVMGLEPIQELAESDESVVIQWGMRDSHGAPEHVEAGIAHCRGRAARHSISQRHERGGMGDCRGAGSACAARRSPARYQCSRSCERNFLRSVDRLPVAGVAQGFAAQEHPALLFYAGGLDGTLECIYGAL